MKRMWNVNGNVDKVTKKATNNVAKFACAALAVATLCTTGLVASTLNVIASDDVVKAEPEAEIVVEKAMVPAASNSEADDVQAEIIFTATYETNDEPLVVADAADVSDLEENTVITVTEGQPAEVTTETAPAPEKKVWTKDDYLTQDELAELSDEDLDAFIDAHTDPVTGFIDLTAGRNIVPDISVYNAEGQALLNQYIAEVEAMKAAGIPLIVEE